MDAVVDAQLLGSVFVTLFVIMDPPGTVPIFLALTGSMTGRQRVKAARQAVLVAFAVIIAFAVFGRALLGYLHISLPALQVTMPPLFQPLTWYMGAAVPTLIATMPALESIAQRT